MNLASNAFLLNEHKAEIIKRLIVLFRITKLPIIVKGILIPEDAELAVSYGVAGIMVSNHGARQLDTVAATVSIVFFWKHIPA